MEVTLLEMSNQPTNDTFRNATPDPERPHLALAIGASGPAWFPPSRAETDARTSAENFNPYHDELGRFTSDSGAADSQSQKYLLDGREHRPKLGAPSVRIAAVAQPRSTEKKEYQGKISAGAYFQPNATGECLIASMHEAVTQVETVRTDSDEPLPEGADCSMKAIKLGVLSYGESKGLHFDFSQAGRGYGAAIQDGLPALSEKFNIHSQPITIDQIPDALKQGPVMVAAYDGGQPHGKLIIGMDKDKMGHDILGSYKVYNPLNRIARASILDASKIVRDTRGRPVLFALRPYRKGEKHPESVSHPLSSAAGREQRHR